MSILWRATGMAVLIALLAAGSAHAAPREASPLTGLWEWILGATPFGALAFAADGDNNGTVPPDPQGAGCGMDPNGGGSACGRGDDPPIGTVDPRPGSGG